MNVKALVQRSADLSVIEVYLPDFDGPVSFLDFETVNPAMATGEIEVQTSELNILSRSTPLPFQLDEEGVDETLRIRYRWLDLRRD